MQIADLKYCETTTLVDAFKFRLADSELLSKHIFRSRTSFFSHKTLEDEHEPTLPNESIMMQSTFIPPP
jgi:hypothetical protein